jgi:beta-glucanase (GH16 family)
MSKLTSNWLTHFIIIFLIVISMAIVGVYSLLFSHAATAYASIEAESGTLNGGASLQSLAAASNGSYVMFGTSNTAITMVPPTGYTASQLILDDKFAGTTLNSSVWNTYVTWESVNGAPVWTGSLPAGDSALGGPLGSVAVNSPGSYDADYCDPSQISVDNGLSITMVPDTSQKGYTYRSACLSTYGKFQFTGGYVQFSVKMPNDLADGGWPALWFLPGTGTAGDGAEIDLFEGGFTDSNSGLASTVPEDQVFASHYHEPSGTWVGWAADTGVDMSAGYHTYGMEYIPGKSISTYFDGTLIHTFTTDIDTAPYEIIIDNAETNSNPSSFHDSGTPPNPSVMSVAEVQVYN